MRLRVFAVRLGQKYIFKANWIIRIGVRKVRISPMRVPSGTIEVLLLNPIEFGALQNTAC